MTEWKRAGSQLQDRGAHRPEQVHRLRPLLHRVLGRRAPVHSPGAAGTTPDGSAGGEPRAHRSTPAVTSLERRTCRSERIPKRRRERVRGLQPVLAGVPGGGLHHDGGGPTRAAGPRRGRSGKRAHADSQRKRGHRERDLAADVLIDGEKIYEVRPNLPAEAAGRIIDAAGMLRSARRHRRAHAPRHAVRRHDLERRLRNRHARGGVRRHHHPHRLRHPGPRDEDARRARHVVEEGRGARA